MLIEAGHTCQNLIMAAANLGYEVFPTDMFHDELMARLANLDPETQWPVYLAAVGKWRRASRLPELAGPFFIFFQSSCLTKRIVY